MIRYGRSVRAVRVENVRQWCAERNVFRAGARRITPSTFFSHMRTFIT